MLRALFANVAIVLALVPCGTAEARAQRLFVYGDSLAIGTEPYLPGDLPDWQVRQDDEYNRAARTAPPALKRKERLAPVVHISLGTADDPSKPRRFRRQVRRTMRTVGDERCVVWANIFRPSANKQAPQWARLNRVLDNEAERWGNLVVVDWFSMVKAHPNWPSSHDGTHVSERGYRARARAVARGVRECSDRLRA